MTGNNDPRRRRPAASLSTALVQQINERTGSRIRGLTVHAAPGQLVVSGRAATFHVKQLAIAACRHVLGDGRGPHLVCNIEVRS